MIPIVSPFLFPSMQNFATIYFWAKEVRKELDTVDRAVGEYMLRDLGIDLAALGDAKDRIAKHFGKHRRRMLEWPLAEVQVMAAAEVLRDAGKVRSSADVAAVAKSLGYDLDLAACERLFVLLTQDTNPTPKEDHR